MIPYLPAILFLFWAVAHSLLADYRTKDSAERVFGPGIRRWYRLAFVVFAIATLVPLFLLHTKYPGRLLYQAPTAVTVVIRALQAGCLALMGISLWRTGLKPFMGISQLAGGAEEGPLDVSGLYRYVRHPLYSLGLILIWSAPVMTTGFLALGVAMSLYLTLGTIHEEAGLLRTYGAPYAEYQQRVGRLIPRRRTRRHDHSGGSPP